MNMEPHIGPISPKITQTLPQNTSVTQLRTPPQKKILIIAEYRGGSTFTSELFNKNPYATFLFEPFLLAAGRNDENRQLSILNEIYNECSLPNVGKYLTYEYRMKHQNVKAVLRGCEVSNVCFRSSSVSLNREPFCEKKSKWTQSALSQTSQTRVKRTRYMNTKCPKINYNTFQSFCQSKDFITSKVIRANSLEMLENDFLNKDENFYVLYVIRDPRGVYSSRNSIHKFSKSGKENYVGSLDRALKLSCEFYKKNVEYLKRILQSSGDSRESSRPEWLTKNRIIPVRYEDLALNPEYYTDKIYDLIGNDKGKNIVKQILLKETHQAKSNLKNTYGTKRDAKYTISAWTRKLNFESETKKIQEYCGEELMRDLGYRSFGSDKEQVESIYKDGILFENWFYDISSNEYNFV